jgi:hypothetical protein
MRLSKILKLMTRQGQWVSKRKAANCLSRLGRVWAVATRPIEHLASGHIHKPCSVTPFNGRPYAALTASFGRLGDRCSLADPGLRFVDNR